jgi:hypothetical protein
LQTSEIEKLKKEYRAIAGDWESGAIAYTAMKKKGSSSFYLVYQTW